jgi:hypothetical protein
MKDSRQISNWFISRKDSYMEPVHGPILITNIAGAYITATRFSSKYGITTKIFPKESFLSNYQIATKQQVIKRLFA